MTKKSDGKKVKKEEACCEPRRVEVRMSCCKIDAVVTVDGRGQIVLPKDVRDKAAIKAGDKFALITHSSEGKTCCMTLIRSDELAESVKSTLGPMLKEILE
jgi:AbrB family looped-hinge helix DNA binding protein